MAMLVPKPRLGRRNLPAVLAARALLLAHAAAMRLLKPLARRPRRVAKDGAELLLTGTFHASNWIVSHLAPLVASRRCRRITVVTAYPVPPLDKVEVLSPPRWLTRLIGGVPSRLVTFAFAGLRRRPHVVGGFHLLLNGLAASLVARLCGAKSLYFCVGGPAEVQGGGVLSENRLFERIGVPDLGLERSLLKAVAQFDLIITMGTQAKGFFQGKGIGAKTWVVPGGVDLARFNPGDCPRKWHVVFVGRLAAVKRIDLLLRALCLVKKEFTDCKAVVVGDGPLRGPLEGMAASLGLDGAVEFAGYSEDVVFFLRRSHIFVLTSETEGLSLALMEALAAGLPAVVPNVGDLPDIVRHGVNGLLVEEQTPDAYAEAIGMLLGNPQLKERFARQARAAAEGLEVRRVARQWDSILSGMNRGGSGMGGAVMEAARR